MCGLKLVSIFVLYACHLCTVTEARAGPFKSSMSRVAECSNPTPPIDKNPPGSFFAELYNTTNEVNLCRGKLTLTEDVTIKKMKAKSYVWENNKWKVSYMLNNMGCNRVFFPVMVIAFGIKYDLDTCTFYKGEYEFKNISVDKLQHMWMKYQDYRRMLWKIELSSASGTILCWEVETLTEPAVN